MPEKKIDTGPLESLKNFQLEEPTGVPDLPGLPDPNAPEFQTGELGRGIQVSRAIAILLAGASDPNLAAALAVQFQRQDLVAREDAQNRYKIAIGNAEFAREEVAFKEEQKGKKRAEQVDVANIKLAAIRATIDAAQTEYMLTQDKDKKEQLPVTISQLESLASTLTPESAKPVQVKSPLELVGLVPEGQISKAMIEGKGEQLVAEFNARQLAGPKPKALLPESAIEQLKANTSDVGRIYIDAMFATVPDPRTDVFGSPADSLTFNSAARKLAEEDPEAHDRVVEQVTQAWVASGRVPDIETAETIFADSEHSGANPEDDPRLSAPGSFMQGPSFGTKLKEGLTKPLLPEETGKKIRKFTEVQGKQQFRR